MLRYWTNWRTNPETIGYSSRLPSSRTSRTEVGLMIVRANNEKLSGFCNLLHDHAGSTAVEFALILPIMISIYLGTVEISNGWAAYRQVSLVTGAAASLVAKQSSITTSQMSDYLNASTAIMSPFTVTGITVTVSCISIASGKATVSWSSTLNGTARAKGSTVSIPSAFSSKSKLVLSEVSYPYT